MIHAGRKNRPNGPGYSWVGGPAACIFFFSSVFRCSSSPMSASVAQVRVGGFPLGTLLPFFFFALLARLSFFSVGVMYMPNK